MGKGGDDDASDGGHVTRRVDPLECDERGVDLRDGTEHRARDPMEPRPSRMEPHHDGDRAVGLGPRRREEPVGDLALDHHAPRPQAGDAHQGLDDERCRDVVGQIGDELCRCWDECVERRRQRVPEHERHVRSSVERLSQAGFQPAVELDRMDVVDAVCEVGREHAEARPDLEHDVLAGERGEALDHTEHVAIDEEVLTERALRDDAQGSSRNAAAAFASICCPSPSGLSSRACASTASVCMTFRGSFRSPRTCCGAR